MADDDRPQYQHGVGTIGGTQFHWGSGTPGQYWSIPYGDYPVTPNAPTGAWAHQAGAIPIANNVIPDPLLGRNRIGIMIHSGSAPSLDQLYTEGCFKVDPQDWPKVRSQILAEADKGPLYLHVAPGGVAAFTNTKTFSQAGENTPAATANATANTTAATQPSGGGPSPAGGFNQSAISLVANQLINRGVKPEVAAGAVAGLMGESGPGLDPTSFNSKDPGGGSGGIGQWNSGRLVGPSGLLSFAQNAGVSGIDTSNPLDAKKVPLSIQAQYLGHELDTTYSGVLKGLQSVSTGQEGLTTWVNNYENPQDKSAAIAQRTQYIQPVSGLLTGTASASAPTPPGTTLNSAPAVGALGTPGGPALPGFGQQQSNQFLQGASGLEKAMGGKGLEGQPGYGDGGQDQMKPSPMGPPPPAHIPNPMQAAQVYGQTLNSMGTPLHWGSGTPGSPIAATAGPQVAAGVPQGATAQQLQQLQMQMLSNPYMAQMMGMGDMGTSLSSSPFGGGYG